MANSFFRFKQFTINQERCAMKVGTDGVLLGAWCDVNEASEILDVGTGTGLIALMLAQRNTSANICGIEIDKEAALQAQENVNNSPWSNRVKIAHAPFQTFEAQAEMKFDLIVSNPPFFCNSLKNPDKKKSTARHSDELPFGSLLACSANLLNSNGRLAVILPVTEGDIFSGLAADIGLHCAKRVVVYPKPDSEPKRLLLEFSKNKGETATGSLIIETETRHCYSPEFENLTKDFYIRATSSNYDL